MSFTAGEKLGPYEIVAPIGAGGMGEVYRARDPRLDRDVAIKISSEQFSERFEREARAVAALNHPNICTLYDVGPNYLVMEHVEGETPRGPLPLDEALRIALQIAGALEAAHEKGITHRDLKPGNIKVRPDGTVKVLDFGLAKILEAGSGVTGGARLTNSPTLMSPAMTMAGVILGTAGYMAPEQARGKPVDKRADIWAFGVVVYELITGERMFDGETISDTLAQVLTKEPDLEKVPTKVRKLLGRCLQKDSKQRLRDIGEVRFWLEEDTAPSESELRGELRARHESRVERGWRRAPWAVAILALASAGLVAYQHFTEETRLVKLFLPPPDNGGFRESNSIPAVSPDGRWIAFPATVTGKTSLWVRDLEALTPRELPGTEDARFPFWSPDSRTVAFFTNSKLKRIDAAGGPALSLADVRLAMGGTWSKDDVIVFAPDAVGGLFRIPAAGGPPMPATEPDKGKAEASHRYPWFLPDGRHFLYLSRSSSETATVYAGDIESKTARPVMPAQSNIAYSPHGYLLFVSGGTLMAQPFDAGKAKTTGEPQPVAERIDAPTTTFGENEFSVSQAGTLIYTSGRASGVTQLTWFDRSGKTLGTVGSPGIVTTPALSPDGTKIVVDVRSGRQSAQSDIWLHDLTHGTTSRVTAGAPFAGFPVWSGNGSEIAYTTNRDGFAALYRKSVSGVAPEELLDKTGDARHIVTDWSRDGQYIITQRNLARELWVYPTSGEKKPHLYLKAEGPIAYNTKLSPNGQWLAYQTDQNGTFEILVETFPKRSRQWQISTNGGTRPAWSRDGRELYFISLDGKMMASEIVPGPVFEHRVPKALFDVRLDSNARFDVSKDGRFLMLPRVEQEVVVPMTVVLNWTAGLKK
jgi:eukaryotic-like serine/threonine-protein kinase